MIFQPDSEQGAELLRSLQIRIEKHAECKGYGYVLDKNGNKAMCSCRQEALYQYRLAMSGIPSKYKTMGFKDFAYKDSDTYRKVQAYLENAQDYRDKGIGLYLYGPSYTGKTLLACSLIMELMKRGYTCRYVSFDAILEQRDGWKKMLQGVHFLCLEKVGEMLEGFVNFRDGALTGEKIHGGSEFLSQVLSHCVNWNLPLIISSTKSLHSFSATFPSLSNLIAGNCKLISCEDKGFRQRKIEQMMLED